MTLAFDLQSYFRIFTILVVASGHLAKFEFSCVKVMATHSFVLP